MVFLKCLIHRLKSKKNTCKIFNFNIYCVFLVKFNEFHFISLYVFYIQAQVLQYKIAPLSIVKRKKID